MEELDDKSILVLTDVRHPRVNKARSFSDINRFLIQQ
jgi:hypothetical protein